jgi:hypothetical protein
MLWLDQLPISLLIKVPSAKYLVTGVNERLRRIPYQSV